MNKAADKLPNMHSIEFRGLPIVIEWPKGSVREGEDKNGKRWKREMKADYGYVPDTTAAGDRENLDVYVGPDEDAEYAYVIEQLKEDGELDEFKVMLGFPTLEDAEEIYLAHYPPDWEETRVGDISEVPFDYLFDAVEEHQEEQGPKEKDAAAKPKCPHCGSSDYGLMPTDFETAKCNKCGKNWDHGVPGINDPKEAAAIAPDEIDNPESEFKNQLAYMKSLGWQGMNPWYPEKYPWLGVRLYSDGWRVINDLAKETLADGKSLDELKRFLSKYDLKKLRSEPAPPPTIQGQTSPKMLSASWKRYAHTHLTFLKRFNGG